ncbi:MAG: anthranilate synthase component I family protein, partial [Sphingobacteriales bacterium]
MKKYKIITTYKKLLADTTTPVSIYLRLRDVFPNSLLLESSDYHSRENSMSFVCCEPVSGLVLNQGELKIDYPDGQKETHSAGSFELIEQINNYLLAFEAEGGIPKIISSGLFGYFTHEAVEHFETIKLKKSDDDTRRIPEMQYHVYRYIVAIDHFKNELYIFHNQPEGQPENGGIEKIEYLIKNKNFPEYSFQSKQDEKSNLTNEQF